MLYALQTHKWMATKYESGLVHNTPFISSYVIKADSRAEAEEKMRNHIASDPKYFGEKIIDVALIVETDQPFPLFSTSISKLLDIPTTEIPGSAIHEYKESA